MSYLLPLLVIVASFIDLSQMIQEFQSRSKSAAATEIQISVNRDAALESTSLEFHQKGLAGLLYARRTWWTQMIAVIIFFSWIVNFSYSFAYAIRDTGISTGGGAFLGMTGGVGLYLVVWGLPQTIGSYVWLVLSALLIANVIVARIRSRNSSDTESSNPDRSG